MLAAKPEVNHIVYHKGDIYIADLRNGFAQEYHGTRPAVIIQGNRNNYMLDTVLVSPMTSSEKIFQHNYPTQLSIDSAKYGMSREHSTIELNIIKPVNKVLLIRKVGSLDSVDMKKLDDILAFNLGIKQEAKGMQELMMRIFDYQYRGKQVRTVLRQNDPWFVGVDVCDILEISNSRDALSRLEPDERDAVDLSDAIGRCQITTVINEPGLYSLVLSSRKPEAKEFKRWITHEVIPQIRKTGSYSVAPQSKNELIAAGYKAALDMIEEMKPKAEQFDRFLSAENLTPIGVFAKSINISKDGKKMGRNNVFKTLREKKILMSNNTPMQQYINSGYFEVKMKPIRMGDQEVDLPQTYITPKGFDWLSKLLNQ